MNVSQWLQAALRDEWDGIGRISRDVRPADVATMANALVGLVAVVLAPAQPFLAAHLILVGILLDGLDGALARLFGGGPLGGFLDSLADLVTFAVAPAVLVAVTWSGWAAAALFMVCAMLRLARFEALRETRPMRYFSGLSSPGAALLVAAFAMAQAHEGLPIPSWALPAVALIGGVLMVSRIRYPKLRGWLGVVAATLIVAVIAISSWGASFSGDSFGASYAGASAIMGFHAIALGAMLGFLLIYLLAGPFYVLARVGPEG